MEVSWGFRKECVRRGPDDTGIDDVFDACALGGVDHIAMLEQALLAQCAREMNNSLSTPLNAASSSAPRFPVAPVTPIMVTRRPLPRFAAVLRQRILRSQSAARAGSIAAFGVGQ
jgi:hypothetical protein